MSIHGNAMRLKMLYNQLFPFRPFVPVDEVHVVFILIHATRGYRGARLAIPLAKDSYQHMFPG